MAIEMTIGILLVGMIGGYLGGLVGIIGATIVPGLILLGVDPVTAISSSLLLHVLISPIGGLSHYKLGHVHRKIVVPLILGGGLGAFFGANISSRLPGPELKIIIGVITIAAGLLSITRYSRKNSIKSKLTNANGDLSKSVLVSIVSIAVIAGLTSGALGLGWGALAIPVLMLIGISPHDAVGSSLLTRAFVALVGVSTFYLVGGLRAEVILPLLVGGIIAIPLGALTTKRLQPKTMKKIVGMVIILLGISILVKLVI